VVSGGLPTESGAPRWSTWRTWGRDLCRQRWHSSFSSWGGGILVWGMRGGVAARGRCHGGHCTVHTRQGKKTVAADHNYPTQLVVVVMQQPVGWSSCGPPRYNHRAQPCLRCNSRHGNGREHSLHPACPSHPQDSTAHRTTEIAAPSLPTDPCLKFSMCSISERTDLQRPPLTTMVPLTAQGRMILIYPSLGIGRRGIIQSGVVHIQL
jgi:hypothetical protein